VLPERFEPMGNKMHDVALALNGSIDRQHAGRENDPPLRLKDPWPDDEIGNAALILNGDEHDALGGPRHLPHQYKSGTLQPSAVARLHRLAAGDSAPIVMVARSRIVRGS
jgi:hypothetical protein